LVFGGPGSVRTGRRPLATPKTNLRSLRPGDGAYLLDDQPHATAVVLLVFLV